jgi:membrane protein YqaA with SNARE-associated domain
VIALAFTSALVKPEALADLAAFYGIIVSTLGTALGGVTGFYFGQRK